MVRRRPSTRRGTLKFSGRPAWTLFNADGRVESGRLGPVRNHTSWIARMAVTVLIYRINSCAMRISALKLSPTGAPL